MDIKPQTTDESISNDPKDIIDVLKQISPEDIRNRDERITLAYAARYLADFIAQTQQTYKAIDNGQQTGEYYGGPSLETILLNPKTPIQEALLNQIESHAKPTNYIPAQRLIRDPKTNEIIAVVQYKEFPQLEDVYLNDKKYAWYLRRIAPIGKKHIMLHNTCYRADKPDHLILCQVIE